jgi:hypothetical protein
MKAILLAAGFGTSAKIKMAMEFQITNQNGFGHIG